MNLDEFRAALNTEATEAVDGLRVENARLRLENRELLKDMRDLSFEEDRLRKENERLYDKYCELKARLDMGMDILSGKLRMSTGYVDGVVTCVRSRRA